MNEKRTVHVDFDSARDLINRRSVVVGSRLLSDRHSRNVLFARWRMQEQ